MTAAGARFVRLPSYNATGSLFFVVLADPQLGMTGGPRDWQEDTTVFKRVIRCINNLHPSPRFCAILGDFVHHHPSIYTDVTDCRAVFERQLDDFQSCIAQLNDSIPVIYVAGNHDVGNSPTSETIKAYREKFGDDFFAVEPSRDLFAIILNSNLFVNSSAACHEATQQDTWLDNALAANQSSYKIVFQHHPMYVDTEDEDDNLASMSHYRGNVISNSYFHIPQGKRTPLLEKFRLNNVHAVFAGHLHQCRYSKQGFPAVEMITTGAVNEPLGPVSPTGVCMDPVDRPGFRIARFSPSAVTEDGEPKMETRYVAIDVLSLEGTIHVERYFSQERSE